MVYDRQVNGTDWSWAPIALSVAMTLLFLYVAYSYSEIAIDISQKEVRTSCRGAVPLAGRYALWQRQTQVEPLDDYLSVWIQYSVIQDGIHQLDVYTVGLKRKDGEFLPMWGPMRGEDRALEEAQALSRFTSLTVQKSNVLQA